MTDQPKFMQAVDCIRQNGPMTWVQVREKLGFPDLATKHAISLAEDHRLLRKVRKIGYAFVYAAVQTDDWPARTA